MPSVPAWSVKKTKERWTIEAFFVNVFLHPLRNPRQCKKPFIGLQLVVMWFIHQGNKSHNPPLQADNPYITSKLWAIPGRGFFEKKCKAFKNQAAVVRSMDSTIHWVNLFLFSLSGRRNLLLPRNTWELLRTRWNVSVRSRSNWNLEVLVLKESGEPKYPEKNLSEQGREPTTNWTPSSTPGFQPGPHCWDVSVRYAFWKNGMTV